MKRRPDQPQLVRICSAECLVTLGAAFLKVGWFPEFVGSSFSQLMAILDKLTVQYRLSLHQFFICFVIHGENATDFFENISI